MTTSAATLFDFSKNAPIQSWRIVNDGVMGGVSKSSLTMTPEGHGKFTGHVSLENNGGFASVQLPTEVIIQPQQRNIKIRVKGDGKTYQLRLKGSADQRESYVHLFSTNGEWQTIYLPLKDFYPQFRGRKLEIPNFSFDKIEQLSFLIANKKEEDFELLIDCIDLE